MQTARKNEHDFTLSDLRCVVLRWLDLEDPDVVDVIMATYVANNLSTDPLWMHIVGPPSHAKTELLRGFSGHQYQGCDTIYFLSNLTPSTLVSGMPVKKGRPEPSLVFRLDGKFVVLKDFTSILSMRSEHQQEIIAQLREMYDGQYSKDFGNGISINWTGHFGLIGACTPVYDMHYGVVAQMGERFILYRIDGEDDLGIGKRAQEIVGQEDQMRDDIRTAIHSFIDRFQDLNDIEIKASGAEINDAIVHLACIVAKGRCPVQRERSGGEVLYKPAPEGPARLTKQLMQLGYGLSLVRETYIIDQHILKTLQKVSRDLMPAYRLSAIKFLWGRGALVSEYKAFTTKEVADGTDMVSKTALRTLEDLMLVGIVTRTRDGQYDNSPYKWAITEKSETLIRNGGLFE